MTPQNRSSGRVLADYLYAKATRMLLPLSGTFELSPVCNFSCRMCYVRKTAKQVRESPRKILTLKDWLRIAREAREQGLLYLLLTGGEPLLWPDFWTLYDALTDMGFLVSVNTNGSLIDDAAVAHFREKPPRQLNVTLYGASDETYRHLCGIGGVFSKIDGAIRKLITAGISVKLNCSLTPENAADLDWIVDYALERETVLSVATYMFPPVRREPSMTGVNDRFTPEQSAQYLMRYLHRQRGDAYFDTYLHSVLDRCVEPPGLDVGCVDPTDGQIRCRAGRASFWITWDGWMTPCGMMPEPKIDVTAAPFPDCWKALTEKAAALRLSGVCDKCPNKGVCHPCAAISYAETGSFSGIPTYMCRSTQRMREIAEEALLHHNKL